MSKPIYEWLPNAFWEKPDRSLLKCIRIEKTTDLKTNKTVLSLPKYLQDGSSNPEYDEVVKIYGILHIDEETKKRKIKKEAEKFTKKAKEKQKETAKILEDLYYHKIKAFEIDVIKVNKDPHIRSCIRRAKTRQELDAYVAIAVAQYHGLLDVTEFGKRAHAYE